jgi:hypothetical protein
MFLGHYAVALAAKRVAPRTSLGTLFLAAQLLDEIWPLLLLAGLERVRIVPGYMDASALEFVHYPISHSLLTALGWSLAFAFGYYLLRRDRVGALVTGALVISHWLLDAPMHAPDLPLWPGSTTLVGGGLWNSLPLTIAIEAGLLAVGVSLYRRATQPRDRTGSVGFYALVAFLVAAFLASFAGVPPNERALAFGALAIWLFVPWAYWVDRHRSVTRP